MKAVVTETERYITFSLLLFSVLLASCTSDGVEVPDVEHIEVDVKLRRFEQDLFALDTQRLGEQLPELKEQYPEFSDVFFNRILGVNDPSIAPEGEIPYLKGFLTYPSLKELYQTTQVQYGDMNDLHAQFNQAFRYWKYYFPEQKAPTLTTFIAEYAVGVFVYGDNDLGIGLDFFLGSDYPYQQYNPNNPNFSAYLTRTFNQEHLVVKSLLPLIEDLLGPPPGDQMLDHMVHNGKKLYILDHLLPYRPDSIIMQVSGEQMRWLEENELEMWAYFLQEDLLYSSSWQDIRKFVDYSPHSPGMPPEAPGRTANYLGWKIVEAYMDRRGPVDLSHLVDQRDAQQLMEQAQFRPRR